MDLFQVQMDTESGVTLHNLKEQLRSKYHRIKKVEPRKKSMTRDNYDHDEQVQT